MADRTLTNLITVKGSTGANRDYENDEDNVASAHRMNGGTFFCVSQERTLLLPHGTIVAVVDGSKFNLFRNAGNEVAPELMPMASPKLDEHNKESGSRHYSSSGNPTGHQLSEDAHAAAVAGWLNAEVIAHRVQHLIVIAAPRTLGELRRHYSKPVQGALVDELHKDFADLSGKDVLEALQKH